MNIALHRKDAFFALKSLHDDLKITQKIYAMSLLGTHKYVGFIAFNSVYYWDDLRR